MNSRQKYNLLQAVEKLKRENVNKSLDYKIITKKKSNKWDDIDILLNVNNDSNVISLTVDDLRIIGNVYDVLKRFV